MATYDELMNLIQTVPEGQLNNILKNPQIYVGLTPDQLQQIAVASHARGAEYFNTADRAMKISNPAGVAAASQDAGFFKPLSNSLQSTVNNFVPGGALLNDVVSKEAQTTTDKGLQTVSTIAGAGAAYGANNPQVPTGSTPTNLATSAPQYGSPGYEGYVSGASPIEYGSPGYVPAGSPVSATPSGVPSAGVPSVVPTGGPDWKNPMNYLPLVPNLIGIAGSKDAANKQDALSREYMAMGAPYRGRLAELYNNPNAYLDTQRADITKNVQQGTDMLARSLSMQGNPVGSGNALQQLQDYSSRQLNNQLYGRLNAERQNMANFGGLSQFNSAAPQTAQNSIDAGSRVYDAYGATGSTLNNIFNASKKTAYDRYLESITR